MEKQEILDYIADTIEANNKAKSFTEAPAVVSYFNGANEALEEVALKINK